MKNYFCFHIVYNSSSPLWSTEHLLVIHRKLSAHIVQPIVNSSSQITLKEEINVKCFLSIRLL